MLHHLEWLITF